MTLFSMIWGTRKRTRRVRRPTLTPYKRNRRTKGYL